MQVVLLISCTWVRSHQPTFIYVDLFFLLDPGVPGVRSLGPDVTKRAFADLTDVTDEDTNSILTDNVHRAIQGNVAMQVTQPGGQTCN